MKAFAFLTSLALASALAMDHPSDDEKAGLVERADTTITKFSFTTGTTLGTGFCGFSIETSSGISDTLSVKCEDTFGGTSIGSATSTGVTYALTCNTKGGGPNGLNECAALRHICITIPSLGKGCATVNLGPAARSICPKKRSEKRQDPPIACATAPGTNLPQTLVFS